ncbi:MAG: protein translocase subunit SecD [Lachnospiraceae bacterium]|jgi:SecD/SecF fusion protein|nr:protein translocase subunit SecD [Lachnospiraceae bacterium]
MNKKKGILSLILAFVILGLLVFTTAVGFGKKGTGAAKNIKLGLDLAGGVSITYEVKNDKHPSKEDMADTIYKLQKRVEQYSTEASVYQEGDNRISIEIPGVTDANKILDELGKPGSLEFKDESGNVVLKGTDVKSAKAETSQDDMKNKTYIVSLDLTKSGTTKFATATTANKGKTISIVYDGKVISAPTVNDAITGGQAQITGDFTYKEAEDLASSIRIGGLKLELNELQSNVVGAQLGSHAISTSLEAGAIGLALVFLFMCFVYLVPGLASSLALLIYVGLVLLTLNAFDLTLTLPGIAGIILSIGMAVDANVIIFARVKEEMSAGKGPKVALKEGFHKAMSAIVDGNVTTLIAAAVLWIKGSGTVKGFAQTLAIGIIISMFTALVITRMIVYAFYAIGIRKPSLYFKPLKEKKSFNFVKHRKIFFTFSIIVMVAGFAFLGFNEAKGRGAFAYSLEFVGGTSTTVDMKKDYTIEQLDEKVVPVVREATNTKNIQVQKVAGGNSVVIKTTTLSLAKREKLNSALVKSFKVDKNKITAENISSTISSEMRGDAVTALIIAAIFMLLYIWFRFKDIRFASSAVIALLHDVSIIIIFYAVSRILVGGTFIAVVLTIVGYSINATIVIFDRIREKLRVKNRNTDIEELVNTSVADTLTRSIYTNLTTFIMVAVLYILGVKDIKEFAMPLMIGIAWGAYSSVFITAPLWHWMRTKLVSKK